MSQTDPAQIVALFGLILFLLTGALLLAALAWLVWPVNQKPPYDE